MRHVMSYPRYREGIGKMRNGEIGNGKYGNEEMSDQTLLRMSEVSTVTLYCSLSNLNGG